MNKKRSVFYCSAGDPSELSLDDADMLQFLESFDSINRKYSFSGFALSSEARAIASRFEETFQFGNLTKHKFNNIADNLKLVYWDPKIIKKDIRAYYLVETKIIHQYFAIPQLDKLFDEDYFNFEWDMHVGQNFNEHRNDYYRDHFIHQIRNLYMMMVMLDNFDIFQASYNILKNPAVGKISEYTSKKWAQFASNNALPQRIVLSDIYKSIRGDVDTALNDFNEQYFFRYVIYASTMLSALFHDMGYPVCHFLETRHRLSNYNPFVYMFTHNAVDSFDQLAAKLGDSLLFTIVSSIEIRESLQANNKGRYNHGAYSAIAFLLQFYENGILYSLSPEKQCAIELAAVAIYNHTVKYDIIKYHESNSYCLPVFRQNPISFLLRFCDDLQEWDRRYFEISSASDFIFCHNCGTPMLKASSLDSDYGSVYKCYCGKNYPRPDSFPKRKLYLVSVADSVTMDLDEDEKTLTARVDYDLYRMLILTNINNTYAKHRLSELSDLKKLVSCQDLMYQTDYELKFNSVVLEYKMSANPLLIKLWILDEYINCINTNLNTATSAVIFCQFKNSFTDSEQGIEYQLEFYLNLLKICKYPYVHDATIKLEILYDDYETGDYDYDEALHSLMLDCLEQYQKRNLICKNPFKTKISQDAYEKPYTNKEDEDALYLAISLFTNQNSRNNNYDNFRGDPNIRKPYISFYIDLLLFYQMNKEINNARKKAEAILQ